MNTQARAGRLNNLDYLRGIAASGIMVYHYLSWTVGKFSSEDFMGRVGIYGVSIFYILSGLTLYYVYRNRLTLDLTGLSDFFRKRALRIFPLLWLATTASIVMSRQIPPFSTLLYNYTGLFGLLDWDNSIAQGAWSIGNELVFYLFFPLFIYCARKSRFYILAVSAVLFFTYLYFTYRIFPASGNVSKWKDYVNPLNQVFLFLAGFLLGFVFSEKKIPSLPALGLIAVGLTLFVSYPVNGNQDLLYVGNARMIFTLSCILICLGFYKFNGQLPAPVDKSLSFLGEVSYSVYLLHPLVMSTFNFVTNSGKVPLFRNLIPYRVPVCIALTLIASYFVYNYFEKFFMRYGSKRKSPSLPVPAVSGYTISRSKEDVEVTEQR